MLAKKAEPPKKADGARKPVGSRKTTHARKPVALGLPAPLSAAEQRVAAVDANLGKSQNLSDFLSEIGWN